MRLFDYDQWRPLAITKLGSNTGRVPAEQLNGVTIHSITYATPEGGEVPALVVVPKGKGPFPGVIVQHGLPDTKEAMLPAGIDLARTGALAILIDAPFNRPQQGRVRPDPLTFTPKTVTSRSSSSWTCAGPSTCWQRGASEKHPPWRTATPSTRRNRLPGLVRRGRCCSPPITFPLTVGGTTFAFGVAASADVGTSGQRVLLPVAAVAYAVVTGLTLYASGHVERRISPQVA